MAVSPKEKLELFEEFAKEISDDIWDHYDVLAERGHGQSDFADGSFDMGNIILTRLDIIRFKHKKEILCPNCSRGYGNFQIWVGRVVCPECGRTAKFDS